MRKSLDVPGSNPNDKSTFVRLEIVKSVLLNVLKPRLRWKLFEYVSELSGRLDRD